MGKKILLVDDEPDIVAVTTTRLETAGYQVISALDGEKGLALARSERPDLIILDLMLPKIDGFKICRMLRFDEKFEHIPIIIFSAKVQPEDKRLAEEVGASFYLTKPAEPLALLSVVKKLLEE